MTTLKDACAPPRRASWWTRSLLVVLGSGPAGLGQEVPQGDGAGGLWKRETLTGDWAGRRSRLEEDGLTLELFYSVDVVSNLSGGMRRATEVLGNVDLLLTADMERLLGWKDGTVFLYGLGTHGGSLSEAVGDLQGVSNIEAVDNATLLEAWYEQGLCEGRLSLLAGLHDVNSEFDVIPAAGLFLHSSQGVGADFGLSGVNGPSTFPVTSLSARLRWEPTDAFYLQTVVADGVPGDPDDPRGVQVELGGDDGLLLAAEIGAHNLHSGEPKGRTRFKREELPPEERRYGSYGKYALGAWGYTTEFDDFFRVDGSGDPLQNRGTHGVYALAEQRLFYEPQDPFQGLSAFARIGFADDRAHVVDHYVGGGATYRGPIPGRDQDRLGLAVAAARLGDDYRTAVRQGGSDVGRWEVALEGTYRAWITPWLSVQPDLQYVIDPGGDPTLGDAWVLGVRWVVSF